MRLCNKCKHKNKDSVVFCEKCGLNLDFETSIYDNDLNRNEYEIRKICEKQLIGKYKSHIKDNIPSVISYRFGVKEIIEISHEKDMIRTLYYNVYLNYKGVPKVVQSIEVQRNNKNFLTLKQKDHLL